MDWTKSVGARVVALVAATALLTVHWNDRGTWFWVGAGLLALNLVALVAGRSGGQTVPSAPRQPSFRHPTPVLVTSGGMEQSDDVTEVLLANLDVPEVVAAFAEGPDEWVQVSYLDADQFEPVSWRFIADHVWLEFDGQWSIALADEVKPYVDLDVDPDDDPLLTVLRAHRAVMDAWHEDREVYVVEQRAPMTVREFGELATRALVAHQRYVRSRAS